MVELDVEAPRLLAVEPEGDGEALSPTGPIRIRFDEALAPSTLGRDRVVLVPYVDDGPCRVDLACAGGTCRAGRCQRDRVDEGWLADAASPPLSVSRRRHAVPLELVLDPSGRSIEVRFQQPLEPRRLHTLLVSAELADLAMNPVVSAGDPPFAARLTFMTSDERVARPMMRLVSPPNDSVDQPINLARLWLAFSKPISEAAGRAVWLENARGTRVPVAIRKNELAGSCETWCYEGRLAAALEPLDTWSVRSAGIVDLSGNPLLAAEPARFATGAGRDTRPPGVVAARSWVADGCSITRVRTDEPSDVDVRFGEGEADRRRSIGATSHDLVFAAPDLARLEIRIRIMDVAGLEAAPLTLEAEVRPRPRIVISEVLANPRGPEPDQEFVELFNREREPVTLTGWTLSSGSGVDSGGYERDGAIPSAILGGNRYALVVGSAYDLSRADDQPPAPGVLIIRLAGRLAKRGLPNRGAPLELRNADGVLVSHYPGGPATGDAGFEGVSVERTVPDSCGVSRDWRLNTRGRSTPGGPPDT